MAHPFDEPEGRIVGDELDRSEAKLARASAVDENLGRNGEYISAIEHQAAGLLKRLQPILKPENVATTSAEKSGEDRSPNSPLAESIRVHGNRLSNVSDVLSYITRNLEV